MITLSNAHKFKYVAASGTLGFDGKGYPWEKLSILRGKIDPTLFTVVTKTITFEKRKGNLQWYNPFSWRCIRLIENGSVNAVGLSNPGFEWFIRKVAPKADSSKLPLIPSVQSNSTSELIKMAERLDDFDFVGIEKNISCTNMAGGCSIDAGKVIEDCKAMKEVCNLPLILKVSVIHNVEEFIPHLRGVVEAISINSVPWKIVFPDKKSPLEHLGGGGVSGKIAQPFTWEMVERLVKITRIPVIGPSVWDFEDIEKLRNMGAKAISFGAIHLKNPRKPTELVRRDMKIKRTKS